MASQELSIPGKVYCPPYPEPNNDLSSRFSSQSHFVFPANPYLTHIASVPCYLIFLLSVAVSPLRFWVPCQFTWTQLLRAALLRVILLLPTLEHLQCTEVSSGAGIKIHESLKTEFLPRPKDFLPWTVLNGFSWELQKGVTKTSSSVLCSEH